MDPAGADMESGEGGRGTWWVWRVLGGCLLAVVLSVVGLIAFREFVLYSPTNVNEVHTISDLRVVISAQAAWQSANGGHFEGELSCLASPASCLPGFPPDGPTLLDPAIASLAPRHGYVRAFAGGRRPKTVDPRVSSRSSVETWTYTARPVERGRTGYRSFHADETGVIRATSEDRAANASDPPIE